jgi:(E)-4-hydroxy-3-methylbut-2-enyl-diphosphate synthase
MTKKVYCGNVEIGGGAPVSIQSMTNTDPHDPDAILEQIRALEDAGCEIVRLTVPDMTAAECLGAVKKEVRIPVIADIHFDHRLAIAAMEKGADKIRINPGNIGGAENTARVIEAAKKHGVPIRVGVNSGSLERDILEKYRGVTAEGLVESALRNVELLEKMNFHDIVVSIKSSDVVMNTKAYRLISSQCEYPLHIGKGEVRAYL